MRAVRGEVVSSKPVALTKAARVFSLFAASDESGLPSDGGALLLYAAEAALELHAFRRYGRAKRIGLRRGRGRMRRAAHPAWPIATCDWSRSQAGVASSHL
ncbi:hypothetical protein E2562_000776 [Oryza meyeriana var. granulata]|uniref:Uncharacterized protein n=1 Tax=Oryza meyeriana var. granulata TaxID=110450 RepID=A0A6G1DVP9_9ORYZ|nr:hypothetical protein E2562_000776 [Oryza meyeriana var. granulata]